MLARALRRVTPGASRPMQFNQLTSLVCRNDLPSWIAEHNRVFAELAAFADWGLRRDLADRKEKLDGELVSGISYAYWQRAFGGSPTVLGQR